MPRVGPVQAVEAIRSYHAPLDHGRRHGEEVRIPRWISIDIQIVILRVNYYHCSQT